MCLDVLVLQSSGKRSRAASLDWWVAGLQDIEKVLEPILYFFKHRRRPGEALGDFTARVGLNAIRQYSKVRSWYLFSAVV